MPAAERQTWWFRGLIVLLGVLLAGLLAAGLVELRRNGVPVWAVFLVIGFFAILCSAQLVLMALGYGWDERGPEAGTPVPAEVRTSWVWRVGLVVWMAINVLATVAAISAAIGGDWGNFVDFGGGATLSWIGFGIAARGKVPSRDFRL